MEDLRSGDWHSCRATPESSGPRPFGPCRKDQNQGALLTNETNFKEQLLEKDFPCKLVRRIKFPFPFCRKTLTCIFQSYTIIYHGRCFRQFCGLSVGPR